MIALADNNYKPEVPCKHTVICTPYHHKMHGHIIQQPSLHKYSCSTKFIATYVGMAVE